MRIRVSTIIKRLFTFTHNDMSQAVPPSPPPLRVVSMEPGPSTCTTTAASVAPARPKDHPKFTNGPYIFSATTSSWVPLSSASDNLSSTPGAASPPRPHVPNDTITLITWNIDFGSPYTRTRCLSILSHLRERLNTPPNTSSTGTMILLQEVYDPEPNGGKVRFINQGSKEQGAMAAILEHEWVQRKFVLVDTGFPGGCGTVTLVSKNLSIATAQSSSEEHVRGCFRIRAPHTIFDRDILGVDLLSSGGVLRICNVHLESLAGHGTKVRPAQLALAASLLKAPGVSAGIVAGDMNAIQTPDFTLHKHNDIALRDVWVDIVGDEKALELDSQNVRNKTKRTENIGPPNAWGKEACHTWGYQSGKTQFYPRRMDKIMYCVNKAAEVGLEVVKEDPEPLERVGVNVYVEIKEAEEGDSDGEEEEEERVWLSDHFGLIVRFAVVEMKKEEGAGEVSLMVNRD
ncbi:Endonuclease/exonuclease/phosphatase [Kalaharituber pfeilii]|nr:Endonuclease/exonuclease/phosphatase [Kalaharituber pfeilii]